MEGQRIEPDGTFIEFDGVCKICGSSDHIVYAINGPHVAAYCESCDVFLGFCKRVYNMLPEWKKGVRERDGYTCQRCGARLNGKQAEAHHLLPVWFMPERQFDLQNGICLCKACHKQLHGYGGTIKNETN